MVSDQNSYFNFNLALENVTKEVNLRIAEIDFLALKLGNYRLCVAKKVNGKFNVIWQCYSDYLSNNYFSWTPQFQLFGTNTFNSQQLIKTTTNVENCSLGNMCVLNKAGFLEKQKSGENPNALTINNEYGLIHSGVKQLYTGISGQMISSFIYVAETNELKGSILLDPKDEVCIWFQKDIQTGTMISYRPSNSIVLDLTGEQIVACLYQDQQWTIVKH